MDALKLGSRAKPFIMAHRGNRVRYPENTNSAFQQAIDDGADIIETDVHITSDGEIVCIHDSTVDRTTDGTGDVVEMTLLELRALNAAARQAELAPEPVPTLSELIDLLPKGIGLAVELKAQGFHERLNAQKLASLLHETSVMDRTVMLSFQRGHLDMIRQVAPELPIGWITLNTPYPVSGVELLGPYWPFLLLNPLYVVLAHLRGQLVCPLDPVPEPRLWYYRYLRCDAVLSDDPAATARALGRSKRQIS